MKYRETGMPDEQIWDGFFIPSHTLLQLDVDNHTRTLVDIEPLALFEAAYHLLSPEGKIGIIHWVYEDTPRGRPWT